MERRFIVYIPKDGFFKGISIVIDGTDCPIKIPSENKETRLLYFSGRSKDNCKGRYCWKYTIGVQISTGEILFVIGPDIGSKHDMKAFLQSDILDNLAWKKNALLEIKDIKGMQEY